VKLRIIVLMLCGVAGAGASFAFADGGTSHGDNGRCKHAVVFGTAAAPQSFTVTVSKASRRGNLDAGQVVTVALGSSGQKVRFVGEGCVGSDGSLTVKEAELHVVSPHVGGDHDRGTTTTTTKDSPTTSTTDGGTTTTKDEPTTTTDGSKTTPRP
jgi:hypothetical protein